MQQPQAQPLPPPLPFAGQSSDLSGLVSMVGLAVVLVVVAVAALRLLRGRQRRASGTGAVQVLERVPLEPRRTVYLLRCRGRELLVAASEGGVRLLTELPATGAREDDRR